MICARAGNIPFVHQALNQSNQELGFLGFYIDDYVDVVLHVCANVAYVAHRLNRFPCVGVHALRDCLDLITTPFPRGARSSSKTVSCRHCPSAAWHGERPDPPEHRPKQAAGQVALGKAPDDPSFKDIVLVSELLTRGRGDSVMQIAPIA